MPAPCAYCGNNPVPHRTVWYNETLNIALTPLRQRVLYNPFSKLFKQSRLDFQAGVFLIWVGEKLKILKRQKDVSKCKVRRAQVLWEEAEKRGIEMNEFLFFAKSMDIYEAKKGEKRIIFSGLPRPAGYTNNWLDLMDDKALFKKKFLDSGLPVPRGAAAANFSSALKIFREIGKPVIVKPRCGSRGRHSTTFIYDENVLRKAFSVAKQLCHWVIVEEQLSGPVYRATLVDFELCGVLRGDPPQIIADGEHNIAELIKIKNSSEHVGVKDVKIDATLNNFLSRQNLSLNSVPNQNQTINLSEKIGVNYGGSSSEDFGLCHPDNKELFMRAAKVLGDPLVGFDFIIPDIGKSWKEQKCGFIEVNSLPFINLHHDPLKGEPKNVAAKVWAMAGFVL